jgi:hypothetical protein
MFAKGFAVILIGFYSTLTAATEAVIFDSRRPVSLNDQEQPPRDYYVNAGSELGLKPGVLVTVVRRMSLYDSLSNRSAGDLQVHIAKVKVLLVQNGLSVVRLHSYFSGQQEVSLDDHFIMIGDQLDVSTAEVDKGQKSAALEGDNTEDMASTAPTEASPPPAPVTVVASAVAPISNPPATAGIAQPTAAPAPTPRAPVPPVEKPPTQPEVPLQPTH